MLAPVRSALLVLTTSAVTLASAAPLTLTLTTPPPAETAGFAMGTARNPSGSTLTVSSRSLVLDGQPWTPVMGEFHYSRYPAAEWREELLKMKAGGIDIVATYVFWIHHEEIEGEWDWTGSRDLRRFIETVHAVGLKAIVRCGPWCHGEVRQGGLPDWIVARGKVRSDDDAYLASATRLYEQIAQQLKGLLWKDGGPVVGVQLENEYGGPAAHLLTLKNLARQVGLDVPLYTRTGWPALKTPMPFGEILPLYGVYAEGFWDRELTSMPGNYWAGFHFSTLRTDANIANEALGRREVRDAPDVARYPYLTCEIGGGMMSSYHRRILVDPRDIETTTLVKLGSGSTSPGYYMYHGGTNPAGRLTTLMEEQGTPLTNWNDMPVKNYDFQAPLGQYGQVRPQYHSLRRLHSFLRECGSDLAGMSVALPDQRPSGRDDLATLRWSARSDGRRGFIFVNHHERGRTLPPKDNVQFALATADTDDTPPPTLTFPSQPVTIPTGAAFIWPFHLDLGGATLTYATAQPVTHVSVDRVRTVFFAATPGVPAEFAFDARETEVESTAGQLTRDGDRVIVRDVRASRDVAIRLRPRIQPGPSPAADSREIHLVLLTDADSLALWKGPWHGRNRIFLSHDPLVFDGDEVRVTSTSATPATVLVHPAPAAKSAAASPDSDGLFTRYTLPQPPSTTTPIAFTPIRAAGPLRVIHPGKAPQPVTAAPAESDFADAAVWRIQLPPDLDSSTDPLLRFHYIGDVARVMIGDVLITDDYFNGNPLEVGLRRHADLLKSGELTIVLLPLQRDAPIFLPDSAKPDFANRPAVAELQRVELDTRPTHSL